MDQPTAEQERIVEAFHKRLAIYRAKHDGADPFGEDCYNRHGATRYVVEAFELFALEAGIETQGHPTPDRTAILALIDREAGPVPNALTQIADAIRRGEHLTNCASGDKMITSADEGNIMGSSGKRCDMGKNLLAAFPLAGVVLSRQGGE